MREFSIQFFLKVGELLLTIPVNPEELEITKELNYDTYANLDKKEILKLQEEKLIELEIESVLEKTVSSASVTDKPWTPETYLNTFNGWKDNRTPVRVTCSDGQIDFEGYIVGVTTSYTGGTDDYGYTLNIVQERSINLVANIDYSYKKIDIEYNVLRYTPPANPTVNKTNNTGSSGSSSSGQSGTYTVKSGDTLSSIARAYYGNASKWPDIYNANRDKIKNANLIYPGQVLTIPNANGKTVTSTSTTGAKSTVKKTTTTNKTSSSSNNTLQAAKPQTSGNEGKDFYKKIQGVEFWGKGTLVEYDKSYNEAHKGMWVTYFYYDSGTYEILGSKSEVVKVGYISSYSWYTKKSSSGGGGGGGHGF